MTSPATLSPRPGFDWSCVSWAGLRAPVPETCCYCDEAIPEDALPLIMWNADGWCACFCDACQVKHWGLAAGGEPGEGNP